ncbi:uncharacterized protein LOC113279470 [Papaver somniferum]|uniref:uncharacterized protein LOC113279470 n=1 Tax=Papaver somniferum TaxID=3469 RepID=UPI000E6FCF76|nr:uncharacterized protein LOC113279470 [Papaver somniferum]
MNALMIFDAEDIGEDMEDHKDPLELMLPISGCNIRKVLIDEGSSINILFYDMFKRMELNDEQLMTSYYTIYGFNGAPTKPLGDIVLEVKAGLMKASTRFSVVNAPSPYNAIIGRRWVHKLKGVAATYHQYLRFPTPEGVMEIKGDQLTARECQDLQINSIVNKKSSVKPEGGKRKLQLKTRRSICISNRSQGKA